MASYNEIFGLGSHSEDASLEGYWACQDNAASTVVVDSSSNGLNGTLIGAGNTSASSTAGPNAWLPLAIFFDGTNDYVHCGSLANSNNATNLSYSGWLYRSSTSHRSGFGFSFGSAAGGNRFSCIWFTDNRIYFNCGAGYGHVALTGTGWHHVTVSYDSSGGTSANRLKVWIDGSAATLTFVGTIPTTNIGTVNPFTLGKDSSDRFTHGAVAGVFVASKSLTLADSDEHRLGPEPLNTVAPVLSGTEQEGETLSCTSGTWDNQGNGALSYTYQWTRSNDAGGTGEADIGGATSATYVLTATDVGKFIRCRVRASNDGGYDSAEDTDSNMSGAISAAGGGPTYTLTAAVGSFSLTGNAATLKADRKLTAAAGSYSLTGIAAALKASRKITAESGTFACTGNAADLVYTPVGGPDYTLTAASGSFTLTGNAAGLLVARKIVAAAGTYSLAGNVAGLQVSRKLTAGTGSYTLTGQACGLRASRKLTAATGSYVMTGRAASLVYSGASGSRASFYYYLMLGS